MLVSWRLVVIALGIGFYAVHAGWHLVRDLGLVGQLDSEAVVRAHLGKTYRYDLLVAGESDGRLRFQLETLDTYVTLSTLVEVEDITRLSPALALLVNGRHSRRVVIDSRFDLDDRLRLSAVAVSGTALGIGASFEGVVDYRGLTGQIEFASGGRRPVHLPGITREQALGWSLAIALPPGLAVGDTFHQRLMQPVPFPPYVSQQRYEFEVVSREPGSDNRPPLLQVAMQGNGGTTVWCDDLGVIHRAEAGGGVDLVLSLTTIEDAEGEVLWRLEGADGDG